MRVLFDRVAKCWTWRLIGSPPCFVSRCDAPTLSSGIFAILICQNPDTAVCGSFQNSDDIECRRGQRLEPPAPLARIADPRGCVRPIERRGAQVPRGEGTKHIENIRHYKEIVSGINPFGREGDSMLEFRLGHLGTR